VTDAGYGVAAISYDPVETLKAFSDKHTITFPLLSDAGSKTITAWGLLNREATGRTAGIPHPGTFMIDRSGAIMSRTFEQPYQERRSATSILALVSATAPGQSTTIKGGQATFVLSASDAVAAVGHRVTLSIRVTPGPKMHVYAPGQKGYIPIALTLKPDPAYKAHPIRFPASTTYRYEPLNETVQVYSSPFTLAQDVTLALTPDLRARASRGEVLSIAGELEYQACDDKVCYRPETIPVEWKVTLSPIVR
jgi:DsbC/DsbD-like thiol-disulfide interchange protein